MQKAFDDMTDDELMAIIRDAERFGVGYGAKNIMPETYMPARAELLRRRSIIRTSAPILPMPGKW